MEPVITSPPVALFPPYHPSLQNPFQLMVSGDRIKLFGLPVIADPQDATMVSLICAFGLLLRGVQVCWL